MFSTVEFPISGILGNRLDYLTTIIELLCDTLPIKGDAFAVASPVSPEKLFRGQMRSRQQPMKRMARRNARLSDLFARSGVRVFDKQVYFAKP